MSYTILGSNHGRESGGGWEKSSLEKEGTRYNSGRCRQGVSHPFQNRRHAYGERDKNPHCMEAIYGPRAAGSRREMLGPREFGG